MAVYLIHFTRPISDKHTCQHYLGYADDVGPRMNAHLHGKGARLTEVAHERGIGMLLVKVWEDGDRSFERKLKNRKNGPCLCPICQGEAVQLPLLPGAACFTPVGDVRDELGWRR